MTIDLLDRIAPKNDGDFGIVEDTDLLGGFSVVADIAARDAIQTGRRKEGMRVKVLSDATTYELIGGILNANWVEVVSGAAVDSENLIVAIQMFT